MHGHVTSPAHLLMDRAYEGDQTRQLASALGYNPGCSVKSQSVAALGI